MGLTLQEEHAGLEALLAGEPTASYTTANLFLDGDPERFGQWEAVCWALKPEGGIRMLELLAVGLGGEGRDPEEFLIEFGVDPWMVDWLPFALEIKDRFLEAAVHLPGADMRKLSREFAAVRLESVNTEGHEEIIEATLSHLREHNPAKDLVLSMIERARNRSAITVRPIQTLDLLLESLLQNHRRAGSQWSFMESNPPDYFGWEIDCFETALERT